MKGKSKILAVLLAIMMLCSVVASPLMSVTAADVPTGGSDYVIVSKKSGMALTVEGYSTANDAQIIQMPVGNYASQVWTLQDDGEGYFKLVNKHSGKSMNVPGVSTDEGVQMIQWNSGNADNEKWGITEIGENSGYYRITPKLAPALALNVEGNVNDRGANILQWTYAGADNELWEFILVDEVLPNPEPVEPNAKAAIDAYLNAFFYLDGDLGRLSNEPDNGFWTDAEILEVFIDAYERLGDAKYLTAAEQFYDGFVDRRGTDWAYNGFNDDVMWMVIATARLYLLTGNTEYLTVAEANFKMCYDRAWDETFLGGGLWWTTDNNSKNACVNGPGAIAACLLGDATGDETYYTKAKTMIDWIVANLFDKDEGDVWDSVSTDDEKGTSTWASTYNQGTFIGACTMLYKHFNDATYFNYANLAAGYAATMGNPMNREQNSGDLIGFKGILARWLGYFARECGVETYNDWMYANAKAAWNNRNSADLMWTEFGKVTIDNIKTTKENIEGTDTDKSVYAAWGCSAAVSWLLNTPMASDMWTVTSPDGNTVMEISLDAAGALGYTATQDGVTVVEESVMGITTSLDDFTTGLTFVSESNQAINETYDIISGKKAQYTNNCAQKTLTFTSANGIEFAVVARAYDDGIAFRYVITADEQEMTIQPNAESTTFNLPTGSKMWYMPRGGELFDDPDNNGGTSYMYEYMYQSSTIGEVVDGIQPTMPMLYETQGKYGLIMEADRHGTYVGSLLRLENGSELRTIFDLVQTTQVNTSAPFTSPWRTVVIGSAADIMENTMVENLSPAPDEETYDFESWVAPGMSSWSWVSYYGGQEDPDIHKKFIDLAADMGWEYYILDEGWQPGTGNYNGNDITTSRYAGMWDWFTDVRDYANEKGVKLFAWVHMSDVDTDEEREARFKEWSEAGIVGIKVDFFYNESQARLQLHDDIYVDAAKYKLMVNVHGSNPSSGEIRTYPNIITREAIKGQEAGGITVEQYTLIPFIRAAVGSADVTEQLYSRDQGKTTMGFQIALSTLIQNGLHSMGSKPEEYYSIPAAVSYYTNFPVTWDDLYIMEDITAVGEQVNLARKSGDAWYAAGISVNATNYDITPSFLDAGKTYTAIIYKEVAGERQNIEMQIVNNVTSTTTLDTIAVQEGGGYAVKFIPTDNDLQTITVTPANVTLDVLGSQEVKIAFAPEDTIATDIAWAVEDENVAMISSTTGTGATIKGLAPGTTTVTVTSAYDATKQAVINVTVQDGKYIFDDATWTVFENNYNYVINNEDSVTITAENGVIDNNIFAMQATDADFEITAKISGGFNADYQGGFIGVFDADQDSYVSIGRRYHSMFSSGGDTPNKHISVMSNTIEQYAADPNVDGDVYVRLVKNGNNFTGYYRVNEADEWTLAYTAVNAELAGTDPLYVGFYAGCGGSTNGIDITVSEFTYQGAAVKVAAVNPGYIAASEIFEAEYAVLANGAEVADNAEASNGQTANNIGATAGAGSATFTVASPYAGQATVKAYYVTMVDRALALSVNGGENQVLTCPGNGTSWTTPLATPVEFTVDLVAGDNTLVFTGNGDFAPDLDYIEVVYPAAPVEPEPVNPGDLAVGNSYEMELGTVTGGAINDIEGASNGADVGNIGGATNGTISFALESDKAGKATLEIYYGTFNDRSVSVTVNGTAYNIACPATGDWHQIGDPVTVEVDVVAGTNTIVFGGVDGGDAPNLDKFAVTAFVPSAVGVHQMEDGTLSGGAGLVGQEGNSVNGFVGNIGGAAAGAVTYEVSSDVDTKVILRISYASGGERPLSVMVNGAEYDLTCASTGAFNTFGTIDVEVDLTTGINTIVFGGVGDAYAPNLDQFEIIPVDEPEPEPIVEKAVFTVGSATAPINATVRVPLYLTNADALLAAANNDGVLGGIQLELHYSDQLTLVGFTPDGIFADYDAYVNQLETGRGRVMSYAMGNAADVAPVAIADITDDTIIGYIEFTTGAEFVTTEVTVEVESVCDAGTNNNGIAVTLNDYIDAVEPFTITKAEVAALEFAGATLTLYSNLQVNYLVEKSLFAEGGYSDPYIVFEFNGKTTVVREYTEKTYGGIEYYSFKFTDIAPQKLGDTITSTLYATYNGAACKSEALDYSIATYCYNQLNKYSGDAYAELRTLLVDLLNYAASAQYYAGYKTDVLVNANLTDEQAAWGTAKERELTYVLEQTEIENASVTWVGAMLSLGDTVNLRYIFDADSIEGLTAKITVGSNEWTVSSDEFYTSSYGYEFLFDGLNAAQMSEPVYVTFYNGDTAVSNTLCYSIESYAYSKQDSTIDGLAQLVKDMMKYGDSAYNYVH